MKITVYSKTGCPFCDKAKSLLEGLKLDHEIKMMGKDWNTAEDLNEAIGKQVRTVPQIIIDEEAIGGYNQLVEYMHDQGLCTFDGKIENV